MKYLKLEKQNSIATLILNRPELRNAFNKNMIAEMTRIFKKLKKDKNLRVLLIKAEGECFLCRW